jgi:hypothetical protein
VTIDDELELLSTNLRRLKIEYEVYFSNPTKRPPADTEWRVVTLIRKFSDGCSDGQRMNFAQRYRYNEMAQRYAVLSDLWRKKMRIREEGYRRPQDALLSVQGVRIAPENGGPASRPAAPFSIACSDPVQESGAVKSLFQALLEAKKSVGESAGAGGSLESFERFVKNKTEQIRKQYACQAVEYTVEVQDGQVRLKAKAKT